MPAAERKYATVHHPTIEALVHGLYRYADREHAVARLKHLAENFVLSKEQPENVTPQEPAIALWIKGYGLTPEEEAKGYTGHFCEVTLGRTDKGQHTLVATKRERPLTQHPQKKRLQSKHPNWGHPVMRAVKKGKLYPSPEAASAELELLHVQFPEVTIPGVNKLFLIIYEKREGIKQPTRKIALELAERDGQFVILCKDNEKNTRVKIAPPPATNAAAPVAPPASKTQVGSFTANELLRQRKRSAKRAPKAARPKNEAP